MTSWRGSSGERVALKQFDRELTAAVLIRLHEPLRQHVQLRASNFEKDYVRLKGEIVSFSKTIQSLDLVYSIEDLAKLEWLGDTDMHKFRHYWTQYTSQMKDTLSDTTLINILLKSLKTLRVLTEDIAHFCRHDEGYPSHRTGTCWTV